MVIRNAGIKCVDFESLGSMNFWSSPIPKVLTHVQLV